ncbi:MAG: hypothetical protein Q9170_005308 [Blastenia crenularia]
MEVSLLNQKRMTRAQAKVSNADSTNVNVAIKNIPNSKPPTRNPKPRYRKKPFPFLLVPAELRIKIYHYALTSDYILARKPKPRGAASLLRTNRQIHSECFEIFYEVNVFQIYIGHLPYDTEAAMANLHYMRQCCLHFELSRGTKTKKLLRHIDKFVAGIWSGKMECLLVDAWESQEWWGRSSGWLEKLSWVRQIHLAQVVANKVQKNGEVKHYRDHYCQVLERSMMAGPSVGNFNWRNRDQYDATPQLGIQLVGEELEQAKQKGGWVVGEDDLYALFGKCSSDK